MAVVRIKSRVSGNRNGKLWPAVGESLEVPEDEARQLAAMGVVEVVDAEPVEAAVVDEQPVETATKSTTPKRRRTAKRA